ncbi:DUF2807 domain-containing protein [Sphingomonas sp. LHG3406-1]|uniref:GIN domain-containing protein n=1 Tax=Sphingomonas sp. LHG3406-1 TaxID=2804617 RepID=UPI00262F35A3|nr:DUF2807 domain-containing protein [Sphingomonas sp. LHG3406-1]
MTRFLALFLLAATTPVAAAGLPRNYSVTSFDRVRVEAPYAVTLTTGKAPSARAEGQASAIDAIDLRVEGRTLIVRRRSGFGYEGSGSPVRIAVSTPDLKSALLVGAGSLSIDRMSGLSIDLAMQGSGTLSVGAVTADRVSATAQGTGSLSLAGRTKSANYLTRGLASLAAGSLAADELILATDGAGAVRVAARDRATITASGTVQVQVDGNPACIVKASGSVTVSGCRSVR